MQATSAIIPSFGPPADVLTIQSAPLPAPGPGQIQVRMRFAPINPADLNLIEGVYGIKPDLPSPAGVEGMGQVEAVGTDVTGFQPGDLVVPVKSAPTWQSAVNVDAATCYKLPEQIDPQQAAMLSVNPATAWCMLHQFRSLQPGEWIIQNAANSGVGRCVIALCRHLGLRSLNLVRRESLIPELKDLGADEVLIDQPDAARVIKTLCGDQPPRLALNAVGGESATLLSRALAPGGAHVTYGAMSKKPVTVSNGHLIFKDVEFRGFWVSRWYEQAAREDIDPMIATLAKLVEERAIQVPVESVFPLSQVSEAVRAAAQSLRSGKILLDLQS